MSARDRGICVAGREEDRQGRPRSLQVAARDAWRGLEALERACDEGVVAVSHGMSGRLARIPLFCMRLVMPSRHVASGRVVREKRLGVQEPGTLESERRSVARPAPLARALTYASADGVMDDVAGDSEQVLVGLHESRAVAPLQEMADTERGDG